MEENRMSNLEALKNTAENPLLNKIKEIKNSGVEFRKLGEVCNFKRGSSLTSKQAINGNIPVISGGQKPAFYHNEANRFGETITVAGSGVYAGFVNYWDIPIFCADCFSVSPNDENILNKKYVYYFLKNNQDLIYHKKVGGAIPHVYSKMLTDFEIPIPPLEVQAEIVRILDTFTELIKELIKEQELRKKQYSYYRDKLLTFETDIKFVKLGEICERITKGTTPKQFVESGINFIKVEAISSNSLNKDKLSFVDSEQHNNFLRRSILQENDVLFCIAGATIGKTLLVTNDMLPANTNQALAIIRVKENVNPSFIKYILSSKYMVNYINKQITGGAQPNLNLQNLSNFEIQLPSLEKQKRIVDILDNFEKYCNDLQIGLPAEIEARKKQYNFYRDKLLTFEPIDIAKIEKEIKGLTEVENSDLLNSIQFNSIQFNSIQFNSIQFNSISEFITEIISNVIRLCTFAWGYCPVMLKSICKRQKGINITAFQMKELNKDDGEIRIFAGGNTIANVNYEDIPNSNIINVPSIIVKSRGKVDFEYYDKPFTHKNELWSYSQKSDQINLKFIYYYLCNNLDYFIKKSVRGAMPQIATPDTDDFVIPLPPLDTQKRIVDILDNFEKYTNDLQEGLPAEIEKRKKQYAYYRDELLRFEFSTPTGTK